MGALVAFDAHGTWGRTLVCDHLIQRHLWAVGADFGRLEGGDLPLPADAPAGWQAHRADDSVERVVLPKQVSSWQARWRGWGRHQVAGDGGLVLWVVQGSLLVQLEAGSGHAAVLCEAREWLALPADLPFRLDAGEAPELDLLVSPAAAAREPVPARALAGQHHALPSHGNFIATLLELTGYAEED